MHERRVLDALDRLAAEQREAPEERTAAEPSALDLALARIDQLEVALEHRTVISQATGLMMQRHRLDSVRALAVLTRFSQDENRQLHEVAYDLVHLWNDEV